MVLENAPKWPLPAPAIGSNSKYNCADASKHQNERDTPRDISIGFVKLLSELRNSQGNREEIESIPAPCQESDEEKHPLLEVEECKGLERVGRLRHGRLQGGDASCDVPIVPRC